MTVLALALSACSDLFVEPAPSAPGAVAVSLTLDPVASEVRSGPAAAYDRADGIRIRVLRLAEDDIGIAVVDTSLAFTPQETETRVSITVELQRERESFVVEAQLLLGSEPLFFGAASVELQAGSTTQAELGLQPVPGGVRLPAGPFELRSLGATLQLEGEVVFATGDAIPDLSPAWSTPDGEIVEVSPAGLVVALAEGDARVVGSFAGHSDTVLVRVRPVVVSVEVVPAEATLAIGETRQLAAVLRDSLNHVLEGRTVADWTSSRPDIAEVDASGLVTAMAAGMATITARSADGPEGAAMINVVGLLPSVRTDSASAVSASAATLWGTLNPNGEDTEAWFEWGPTSDLGATTLPQSMGSGTVDRIVEASLSGLEPGAAYFFRLVAQNERGRAEAETLEFRTLRVAPAAPSNLTATAVSSTEIELVWQDNSDNEEGFGIERCTGEECADFEEIAVVGANVTSYLDTGLSAETAYRYRVWAFNEAGNSDFADIASATTHQTVPAAPSDLTATAVSSTQIDLSWTDNSDNEEGFRIERCAGEGCADFEEIATAGAGATGYQDTDLSPETSYRYRVRAFNAAGNSPYSNTATAATPALPLTPPAAPSDLTATAVSSTQIDLSWGDNSDNEEGFRIERCTGEGCADFAEIATVGANVMSYQDTGLAAETSYSYRVQAFNAAGDSRFSNTATASTPAAPVQWAPVERGTTQWLQDIWGSAADDVYAVGLGGTIVHFDGRSWAPMASETNQFLFGVWGSARNDVYAVGAGGTILHFNGGYWEPMTSGTNAGLNAIWGSEANDVYAVGVEGTILHFDGRRWAPMAVESTELLYGIWGSAPDNVYAVGRHGTILHFNGSTWAAVPSETFEHLLGIWGSSAADVYVVGSGGTVLHFDGTSWAPMTSGTLDWLYAVWGSARHNVYAVGETGAILRFDGTRWAPMTSGTTAGLNGVWGAAADDVYAVGNGGTILHGTH